MPLPDPLYPATRLRIAEAAEYLGFSTSTLDNWRSLGKGPRYYKAGSRIFYIKSELDAWIHEGAVDPTENAAGPV